MKLLQENIKTFLATFFLLFCFSNAVFSQDVQPPEPPVLKSLSVDQSSGAVEVSWFVSGSPDTWGYLVYRNEGSMSVPDWQAAGDTIEDAAATYYLDLGANANMHVESYRVIAIDSSGNTSLMSAVHTTMYSFPYLHDKECPPHILLDWSAYAGWGDSLSHYMVYAQAFPGSFQYIDSLPRGTTEFYHYGIQDSTKYCYFIEAIHKDGSRISRSNITCGVTEIYQLPEYLNNNYVTVSGYNTIKVSFSIDTTAESMDSYKILRSCGGSTFDTIAIVPVSSQSEIIITDTIDTFGSICSYKIAAFDQCDHEVIASNEGNNIILKAWSENKLEINLSWTRYHSWRGDLAGYDIYRSIDYGPPEYITTIASDDTVFQDDLSSLAQLPIKGEFCYYVESVEENNPIYIGAASRSNVACASHGPVVYVANAFSPNGDNVNDIFAPKVSFASTEDYTFIVYNRFGLPVFETNDLNVGWDGKINGHKAPLAVYVYFLKFSTSEKKVFEQSGHFTLIR